MNRIRNIQKLYSINPRAVIPNRVPQGGVKGAVKFEIIAFLLVFYYIRCPQIFTFKRLSGAIVFKDLKGVANQKSLKNTALGRHRPMGYSCQEPILFLQLIHPYITCIHPLRKKT